MSPEFLRIELEEEFYIAFVFITSGYLVLCTLIGLTSKSNSLRLVGLGLVTAVAATGYAGLVPTTMSVAPLLMKIAALLVLGGILIPFLNASNGTESATANPVGSEQPDRSDATSEEQ